ncbi:hypothetical protein JCM11251_007334 [Rhodosporidiobolus azoricus]
MTACPASADSDYGSEIDWDEAAETQLVAHEQIASSVPPTSSSNLDHNASATVVGDSDGPARAGVNDSAHDESAAARLAEALREFGVAKAQDQRDERSLWERYRQRRGWGALSVSDLSGPSWCEVQHSYRLASKPYLPPLERPATIITSNGTSIPIDTSRTVKREAVLDKGKAVHSKIEREVMGPQEKVEVEIAGKEEWWALRIVNLLVCLETLLETGRVREVPVVGWIRGFLVFGVIDDIERRDFPLAPPPSPTLPHNASTSPHSARPAIASATPAKPPAPKTSTPKRKGKKPAATPEKDSQRSLKDFFTPVLSPSKKGKEKAADQDAVVDLTMEGQTTMGEEDSTTEPEPEPVEADGAQSGSRVGFVLSDTKTRFNRSLPAKPESRAARLQLMLYRRLFTSLLQPEPPPSSSPVPSPLIPTLSSRASTTSFSWSRLYSHLSLNPSILLSSAFLRSIEPILAGSNLGSYLNNAKTLSAFVEVLGCYGEMMRGEREPERLLEEKMEISYRLREEGSGWRGRRSARGREGAKGRTNGRGKGTGRVGKVEQRAEAETEIRVRASAVDEDEEQDLQRAIELSLQDTAHALIEDCVPVGTIESSAANTPAQRSIPDEEIDTHDSPLVDSQLPFLANPSLPLALIDVPHGTDAGTGIFPPSFLPSQAFDLPLNSQGSTATASPPPAAPVAMRSGRYNLRRRPAASSPGTTRTVSLPAEGRNPSPPRKKARSASPAQPPECACSRPASSLFSASTPASPSASSPSSSPSSSSTDSSSTYDPSFIGTETFLNDPTELDAWLASVTAYWRGERDPVGVAVTEVKRCRTCEFEDGCEWRAMKAKEAVEQAKARRAKGSKPI